MRKSRIVFAYQFLTMGGVEVVLKNRLAELEKRGFAIRFLFLEELGGLPIFQQDLDKVFISNHPDDVQGFLADFDPDWVVSIDTPQVFPWAGNAVPNAKLAYEVHSPYALALSLLLRRESLAHVRGIIVPSPSQGIVVRALTPLSPDISVVQNGLDRLFLQPPETDEVPDRPILLWVGRLDPLKNWRAFVEIASLIHPGRSARFCLVGGEKAPRSEQDSLQHMLRERKLDEVFEWLPSVSHAEMPTMYQRVGRSGGCVVSTSWAESFGMVALEAMACGCPVVVPNVIGLCDVVTEGATGIVYEPGAVEQAASKILHLLDDEDLRGRLASKALQEAQRYSIDRSIDAFVNTLDGWQLESKSPGLRQVPQQPELNHHIALLSSAMKAYCAQVRDYVELLAEQDKIIQTQDARLNELAEQPYRSEPASELLRDELNATKQQLEMIQNSLTWKILQTWVRLFHGSRFSKLCEQLFNRLLHRTAGSPVGAERATRGHFKALMEIIGQNKQNRGIIVIPPTVDWSLPLYQRPQHMALHLAKLGYLIFYCTSNSHSDNCRGFSKLEDNLYLTNQFKLIADRCENLILDLYSTSVEGMNVIVGMEPKHVVVYEYVDHIHENIFGSVTEVLRAGHRLLKPDIVLASATELFDEMAHRFGPGKVVYLPNGVDYDHFCVAREPGKIPQDIKHVVERKKPIIGYFGALAVWLDYDLINSLAKKRPEYQLLIIGVDYDGSLHQLDNAPNIHYLGQKPYKILPNYGAWFDVSIIPFQAGKIADTTSPIKLFEYMALGTPIVTTDMKECKRYKSVLWTRNAQEFIESVDRALELRQDRLYLEILNEDARANTWQARAECFDRAIQDIVANS